MGCLSNAILALSMSADAFAVSVGRGVVMKQRPKLLEAARTGLVFGGTEALAPIVGWLLGSAASLFIQAYDHWVAFAILGLIGGKMIREAFTDHDLCEVESHKPSNGTLGLTILTAMGTSIDSVAVGVSLAFVESNIWLMAAAIGTASFTMSTLGLMIGHYVGCAWGRRAEMAGGIGLIAIGLNILYTHIAGM